MVISRGSSAVVLSALLLTVAGCTRQPDATPAKPERLVATATAYCQSGITKSGEKTRPGVIAADPRILPLGSVVRIDAPQENHDGIYHVLDTGSAVIGKTVDIYMPSCRSARQFGRRDVVVDILEWGARHPDRPVGTSGSSSPSRPQGRAD